MPNASPEDPDSNLPPPGSRSGAGAQSVLPYLTKTLQAKPSAGSEPRSEVRASGSESVFAQRPPPTGS